MTRVLSGRPAQPRSPLVGRAGQVPRILDALAQAPLVTLTGPGGAGKTRLAIAVQAAAGDLAPDGTGWVELADIRSGNLVADAVALAVDAQPNAHRSALDAALERLADAACLLVVDNCEHLVTACAGVLDALLDGCPGLRVLATSREPLGVAGERIWPVPPLAVPPSADVAPEQVRAAAAVELFAQRARAHVPSFEVSAANAAAVAALCRRLDGLPLALEIAAARLRLLSVAQIVTGLDGAFRLLDVELPSLPPRHRTLRATLDWSRDLLSDHERTVFRRLAVFPATFDFAAAQRVVGGPDVLDALGRLVDRSLLAVRRGDPVRYRLLEPVRGYALELLDATGEAEQAGRAHLTYFRELAERCEPLLTGATQVAELDRLEVDGNNLRAALAFARDHPDAALDGVRLIAALGQFCALRGHYREGRQWLDWAATVVPSPPAPLRAKVLLGSGRLALLECDYPAAVRRLEAALQHYRAEDDPHGTADALQVLGSVAREQGRYARAEALHEEARELYAAAGDAAGVARSDGFLAFAAWLQRDWGAAIAHGRRALAAFRALGDPEGMAWSQISLGTVAQYQGSYDRAETLLADAASLAARAGYPEGVAWAAHERGLLAVRRGSPDAEELLRASLAGHRALGDRWRQASVLTDLAGALVGTDPSRAAALLGAAVALREEIGTVVAPCEQEDLDRTTRACQDALGEQRYAALWAAGYDGLIEDPLEAAPVPSPAGELVLRMLGAAEVSRGNFGYAKPRELLFLLAASRALSKEQIGLALWPELDGTSLRNAFHTALRDLRRALGDPGWISYSGGRYALDRSRPLRCDLHEFETALTAARSSPSSAALPHLQRAVAAYGGDLLPELDGDWVAQRRTELRREYGSALAALGRLLGGAGRTAEALPIFRRAVEHDPLDEAAHRGLMRCLASLGEVAQAARVYRELTERLRAELGVAPAADTTALYRKLSE